jgi:hypothetical protein
MLHALRRSIRRPPQWHPRHLRNLRTPSRPVSLQSLPSLAVALAAAVPLALAACDGITMPGRTPPAPRAVLSDTAQVAHGVGLVLTMGGMKRAEVRADSALFNEAVDRVELRAVRVTFLSELGDTSSTATAPAATYDLHGQRVTLHGGATVVARNGQQLAAPRVIYEATGNRLLGDTTYALTGPGGSRSGKSFETDPTLRNVHAPKPVASPPAKSTAKPAVKPPAKPAAASPATPARTAPPAAATPPV